jgi:chromate transporter
VLKDILDLFTILAPLSLVAVGGANAVLPDIHRQVVAVNGWMTDAEFSAAFTLAQTVPGPNILVVCLIGWHVAGLPGALAALLAMCGPSSLLALIAARSLSHVRVAFWRQRLQVGLGPLTVGLVLASSVVLARGAGSDPIAIGMTVVSAIILLRSKVHPLLLMALGAAIGVARAFV